MTLRLFDSGTSSLCTFAPLRPGRVGIYLCGPTVQAPPHVGHLRSAVVFDQLRRWLQIGHELDVTLVRNITDLDDKILAAATRRAFHGGRGLLARRGRSPTPIA